MVTSCFFGQEAVRAQYRYIKKYYIALVNKSNTLRIVYPPHVANRLLAGSRCSKVYLQVLRISLSQFRYAWCNDGEAEASAHC